MRRTRSGVIAACAVAVIVLALILWRFATFHDHPIRKPASEAVASAVNPDSPPADATSVQKFGAPATVATEREKTIWQAGLATPIRFYGRVVDEDGVPIENATAEISIHDRGFSGNSKTKATTDSDGRFDVSGRGLGLGVMVSKPGYYSFEKSRGTFGYAEGAGTGAPHKLQNDPATFVLRKKGETVPLVAVRDRDIRLPVDGTAVAISFRSGTAVPLGQGDLQIEALTTNRTSPRLAFDWKCRISVPGGGLIKAPDQGFNFIAPSDGYVPADDIEVPARLGADWRSQIARDYFLRLRDGTYARAQVAVTVGSENFASITSYLNPTPGDRNLEYDPAKQVKAQ